MMMMCVSVVVLIKKKYERGCVRMPMDVSPSSPTHLNFSIPPPQKNTPAHLDAPSLHLLVAETGGAVLLYASAQV